MAALNASIPPDPLVPGPRSDQRVRYLARADDSGFCRFKWPVFGVLHVNAEAGNPRAVAGGEMGARLQALDA